MLNKDFLLKLDNVSYKQRGSTILENISFSVNESSILTVIGPNGAGKSTLSRLAAGIIRPTSGQIIRSKNIKVGYVPQKFHLRKSIPVKVIEFLKSPINPVLKLDEVMQIIDLSNIFERNILDISGGELKKTLIARALMNTKDLLILDEAASCLDLSSKHEFYSLIKKINSKLRCAILLISHDLFFVLNDTTNVVCINKKLCCQGRPKEISNEIDDVFMNKFSEYKIYTHLFHNEE